MSVKKDGLISLGAPVSNRKDFLESFFLNRVSKAEGVIQSIYLLEDPQLELHLLRSCAALPKITFSLRTCDPRSISRGLLAFDSIVHSSLESISGSAISAGQRLQSSLPVAEGGLGIPLATEVSPVAFLGSFIDTHSQWRNYPRSNGATASGPRPIRGRVGTDH